MKDCNNCKHRECWGQSEPCNACTNLSVSDGPTNWEPCTNEDRLNVMTTEEKAEFLATTQMNILFLVLKPLGIKPVIDKDMVVAECLDWLKQEVDK